MPTTSSSSKYVKFTLSLREDVYAKVKHVMDANGLDRSAAIALLIQRVDLREVLPKHYLEQHPEIQESPG